MATHHLRLVVVVLTHFPSLQTHAENCVHRYRPRYGYGSAANDEPAVIELPDQADPFEDQFEKRANSKTERIKKNQKQQLRNLADARKTAENAPLFKDRAAVKGALKEAFAITKVSG